MRPMWLLIGLAFLMVALAHMVNLIQGQHIARNEHRIDHIEATLEGRTDD